MLDHLKGCLLANGHRDDKSYQGKDDGKEKTGSTTKAGGFTFSDIITSISKIFKSENLDKDITE
jgi:hypothetical protein